MRSAIDDVMARAMRGYAAGADADMRKKERRRMSNGVMCRMRCCAARVRYAEAQRQHSAPPVTLLTPC